MNSRVAAALALASVAACSAVPMPPAPMESTYWKVFARAESGDAEAQNAVAFMLYHGEGVGADRAQARFWFDRAARQGNERARRNLAFLADHPDGPPPRRDDPPPHPVESAAAGGERAYATFCGGCHGNNGIAAYENSPSFAFGERLEKADAALMRSMRDGLQEMPGWEGKLAESELREILAFVRTLPLRYERGIAEPLRGTPAYVYLFGPMEERGRRARE
jgi:TPR repeat protein